MKKNSSFNELTEVITNFRDARDWKQFHTAKDMALSLVLEASEVLEIFQWQKETNLAKYSAKQKSALAAELSDVLYWVLLMAHDANIDLQESFLQKMKANNKKYPVTRARGSSAKYSKLP